MLPYNILPEAEKDLDEYALYIAKDNLQAALKLYDAAEKTYSMFSRTTQYGRGLPLTKSFALQHTIFPDYGF